MPCEGDRTNSSWERKLFNHRVIRFTLSCGHSFTHSSRKEEDNSMASSGAGTACPRDSKATVPGTSCPRPAKRNLMQRCPGPDASRCRLATSSLTSNAAADRNVRAPADWIMPFSDFGAAGFGGISVGISVDRRPSSWRGCGHAYPSYTNEQRSPAPPVV